jgi:hypothetical protein
VGVVTRIHSSAAARTLRVLVAACGVAMIAAAGGLLLQWRQVDGAAERYLDSPCTQHPVAGACAGVTDATVLSTAVDRDAVGTIRPRVRLVPAGAGPAITLRGVWPNDAFLALRPGMHVAVIATGGRPATIRLDPTRGHPAGLRLWTVDNPLPDRDLLRDLGLAAGGVGILAVVLAAPSGLTRLPRRRLAEALADRRLRVAMLGFTAVQMLDVATSIAGRHRLLYEGVALTRAVVARWGDAGFLVVKLPALLAVAVLAARLPRRWAVIPLLAATAPVALVVGGNLRLLAGWSG